MGRLNDEGGYLLVGVIDNTRGIRVCSMEEEQPAICEQSTVIIESPYIRQVTKNASASWANERTNLRQCRIAATLKEAIELFDDEAIDARTAGNSVQSRAVQVKERADVAPNVGRMPKNRSLIGPKPFHLVR